MPKKMRFADCAESGVQTGNYTPPRPRERRPLMSSNTKASLPGTAAERTMEYPSSPAPCAAAAITIPARTFNISNSYRKTIKNPLPSEQVRVWLRYSMATRSELFPPTTSTLSGLNCPRLPYARMSLNLPGFPRMRQMSPSVSAVYASGRAMRRPPPAGRRSRVADLRRRMPRSSCGTVPRQTGLRCCHCSLFSPGLLHKSVI